MGPKTPLPPWTRPWGLCVCFQFIIWRVQLVLSAVFFFLFLITHFCANSCCSAGRSKICVRFERKTHCAPFSPGGVTHCVLLSPGGVTHCVLLSPGGVTHCALCSLGGVNCPRYLWCRNLISGGQVTWFKVMSVICSTEDC